VRMHRRERVQEHGKVKFAPRRMPAAMALAYQS
jgi:hypothetical protein